MYGIDQHKIRESSSTITTRASFSSISPQTTSSNQTYKQQKLTNTQVNNEEYINQATESTHL